MANNEYINKVVYGNATLMDISGDTVTADKILTGYTAHNGAGAPVTGSCTYDCDSSDATASVSEVLVGETYYKDGNKYTGTMVNRGAVTGTISTKDGVYTIPVGFHDGSGSVGISATEKSKLVAQNIAEGVTLLGVVGSHSGTVPTQSKTFTPTVAGATVTPDSGYNLYQVVVNAIPYTEVDNPAGGKTVTIAG